MPKVEVYGPVSKIQHDQGFTTVSKAVESAKQLGSLDSTTIWAFMFLLMVGFTIWRERNRMKSDENWQEIRRKGIEAALQDATATAHLVEEMGDLKDTTKRIETIIDERLPKGGNRV